jgi:hypothetical protein
MVRVRRNSKDGTYTTTSDSSEDGFDSDSNNSSSILGDDRSDGHYYDYATFEETFDNVVNEDGFPLISLEMHLRFCFEAVDTMAQALSNTPSITNPVKKKLVKNITSVKDEVWHLPKP